MRESDKRPAEWQWVTLVETSRGKFSVVLPITHNPVSAVVLNLAGLDGSRKTTGLGLKAAVELGQKVEDWRERQEVERRRTRKNGRKTG